MNPYIDLFICGSMFWISLAMTGFIAWVSFAIARLFLLLLPVAIFANTVWFSSLMTAWNRLPP